VSRENTGELALYGNTRLKGAYIVDPEKVIFKQSVSSILSR
jgi:hypothetical protein